MTETFQINTDQAEAYEAIFVPAIFGEWAPLICDMLQLRAGQRLLDVACGTGIVAREAAGRVGDRGTVVGVDLNSAMLQVAQRVAPDLDWRQGDVAKLPCADAEFDAVSCSAALFFFPDKVRALSEMARVVRPGGAVGLLTFSELAEQPGYGPFVDVVVHHAGPDSAALLSTYWSCGDRERLADDLQHAGLAVRDHATRLGTAHFPSVGAMAETEIRGTPLRERIPDAMFDRIVRDMEDILAPYTSGDGTLAVPLRGLLTVAGKESG